jgi:hypothetical protein
MEDGDRHKLKVDVTVKGYEGVAWMELTRV